MISLPAGDSVNLPKRGAQALSVAFQLLTMAEQNTANQVERLRETVKGPASDAGSWAYQLDRLKRGSYSAADVGEALPAMHVQPVMTAHPTEAKRAAVLERMREIYLLLVERENPAHTPIEQRILTQRLETCIERLWRTGEIHLKRPDVASEIRNTLHYISNVFPDVLELMSDRFEEAWKWVYPDTELPQEPRLTFGSWVGGDRDGHPFVTTDVTRYALEQLRGRALEVLDRKLYALAMKLSISEIMQPVPEDLHKKVKHGLEALDEAARARIGEYHDQPWRQWVHLMRARLPLASSGGILEPTSRGATPLRSSWMKIWRFWSTRWMRSARTGLRPRR